MLSGSEGAAAVNFPFLRINRGKNHGKNSRMGMQGFNSGSRLSLKCSPPGRAEPGSALGLDQEILGPNSWECGNCDSLQLCDAGMGQSPECPQLSLPIFQREFWDGKCWDWELGSSQLGREIQHGKKIWEGEKSGGNQGPLPCGSNPSSGISGIFEVGKGLAKARLCSSSPDKPERSSQHFPGIARAMGGNSTWNQQGEGGNAG